MTRESGESVMIGGSGEEVTRVGATIRETSQTCYIEFYLQRDLIGQSRISEQLIGLLQRPVFCGDSID